jgi:large subunit ribosomal protein L21
MNFAVIKASGKQYKVSPGSMIEVDRIEGESGKTISFEEVLLTSSDDNVVVGMPYIKGASVTAKIVEQLRGGKVRVAKFRAKSKYRRVTGFRPSITKLEIVGIKGGKE